MEEILRLFTELDDFGIIAHVAPDGDAVGAVLALFMALRERGKRARLFCDDDVSFYSFLPGAENFENTMPQEFPRVAVAVDCADKKRAGRANEILKRAEVTINIDHHFSNEGYAQYNWIMGDASSSSEMIYYIIRAFGITPTKDMAMCLYAGIIYDTGNFAYSNTTPQALRAAAEMIEYGADVVFLVERIFNSRSEAKTRILGRITSNFEICCEGRVAFYAVTQKEMEELGADAADCDSAVSYLREIDGVEIAMLLRELKPNMYKVSLRSKFFADVSKIAAAYGGGGHHRAAGCQIPGELPQIRQALLDAACEALAPGA